MSSERHRYRVRQGMLTMAEVDGPDKERAESDIMAYAMGYADEGTPVQVERRQGRRWVPHRTIERSTRAR